MAVNLETFFTALSERAYKENDLSDMTYALCQSDEVFQLDVVNEDEKAIANSGTAGAVVGWIGVLFDREKNNSPRMVLQLPVNRVRLGSESDFERDGVWYTFKLNCQGSIKVVDMEGKVREIFENRQVQIDNSEE